MQTAGLSLDQAPPLAVPFGFFVVVPSAVLAAGLVLHGMLTRIVPFLVWFHRFSEDAGRPGVPSMRQLMPNERARVGLILHGAAVLLGAAAIVSGVSTLLQVAGVVLAAAGVALGYALVRAVVAREP